MKKILIGLLALMSFSSFAQSSELKEYTISPASCELRIVNTLSNSEPIWAAGAFMNTASQLQGVLSNKGYRLIYDKTKEEVAMTLTLKSLNISKHYVIGRSSRGKFLLEGEHNIDKSKTFIHGPLTSNGSVFEKYLNWVIKKMPDCK